jgi:hypothetical protein
VIRETHTARYVYWQFPFYELELGKGPRDTIQVLRQRWLPEPATVSARTLAPGTPLTSNRQPVTTSAVSITLGERGLGLDGTSAPIAIPEFLSAYSMLNLENVSMSRLGHDYEAFEDLSIRSRYFATTRVVYNNRGSVPTSLAALTAGADGNTNENFLNNLYAYMSGLQIPCLDDGCCGGVLQVDDTSVDRVWVVAGASGQPGERISLNAGDRYFFLPVSNLDQVWLVATVNVQVNYWAI